MSRDRIVVVGAAGFLGRACAETLARGGLQVDCVDLVESSVSGVESWTIADVAKDGVPEMLLRRASTLFHFAWRNDPGRGNDDMTSDVRSNVAGAVRVFEQAARVGIRRIVYPSSGGTVYGRNPEHPTPESAPIMPVGGYGAGKAAAELYLQAIGAAYGVETCSLRIANPYGPGQFPNRGQGFIATAIARTLRREPIEVFGSVELARDYIYIDDLTQSFLISVDAGRLPPFINLGSGTQYTIAQLIPLIFTAVGHETDVVLTSGRPVDVPRVQLDVSLAKQVLQWFPATPIEIGLKRTVDWVRTLNP